MKTIIEKDVPEDDGSGAKDLSEMLNQAKGADGESRPLPPERLEEIEGIVEKSNNKYTVLQRDVGKTLGDLIEETSGMDAKPLSDEDITMLDDFIMKGYASTEFPMGSKSTIEFQTAPSLVVLASDTEVANYLKRREITNLGAARLNSIHLSSVYLYKYGELYPSFPINGQPKGGELDPESLRQKFESENGLYNRIDFCMGLDGLIIDRIAQKLRLFQAKCSRVLSYEGLEDF